MFSKYELYSTAESPYCYRGTAVLRNRLNIRDNTALKAAEEEITAIKQYELLRYPIRGHFSKTHLCRIHRFLFEDIYLPAIFGENRLAKPIHGSIHPI